MSHTLFSKWGGCTPSSLLWRSCGFASIQLRRKVSSFSDHSLPPCNFPKLQHAKLHMLSSKSMNTSCISLHFFGLSHNLNLFAFKLLCERTGTHTQQKHNFLIHAYTSSSLFPSFLFSPLIHQESIQNTNLQTASSWMFIIFILSWIIWPLFVAGRGIYILYEDVKSCPYEDVHVLWSILVEAHTHTPSLPSKGMSEGSNVLHSIWESSSKYIQYLCFNVLYWCTCKKVFTPVFFLFWCSVNVMH